MAEVRNDPCLENYFVLQVTLEKTFQDKVLVKMYHFPPLEKKNDLHLPEKMIDSYQKIQNYFLILGPQGLESWVLEEFFDQQEVEWGIVLDNVSVNYQP